jgi:hypothetical protein
LVNEPYRGANRLSNISGYPLEATTPITAGDGVAVEAVVFGVNLGALVAEPVLIIRRAGRSAIPDFSGVDSVTKPEQPMSPAEATAE